ncbi:hypothetical protein MIND_00283000 [Mycena indigotica]|uniref:F-box domain-containing protein n=1 Tax=Mycena indigotica TaxID=2126181 RepID=A0A8H6T9I9_9AGAR|nr:uncharacterized protein MIND_00283000 [Mycena indigotica]KAF7312686.1 hypothetical protein MIND_00283000 [Mycena indigotica]
MIKCSGNCPSHCVASISYENPAIPHPNLVHDNDAVPTDAQVDEIRSAIALATQTLASIDQAISTLLREVAELHDKRRETELFIASQSAVIAGVRRLSNELLLEIFSYCANPVYPPFHKYNPISKILQVSGRWRAVALGFPCLWQNINLTGGLRLREEHLLRHISLQIERTGQTPLSVLLRASQTTSLDLLGVVMAEAARWRQADIHLYPFHLQHIFSDPIPVFGMLTKLLLVINRDLEGFLGMEPEGFLGRFPALVELSLKLGFRTVPPAFHGVWGRLLQCKLEECRSRDVLHILPLFSQGCRLIMKACGEADFTGGDRDEPSGLICRISALSIVAPHSKDVFFGELLNLILVAPHLRELCLPATQNLVPSTISFLARSGCALSHLRLQTPDQHVPSAAILINFLKCSELQDLLYIDLVLHKERDADSIFDLFLQPEVLARLETLTIRETDVGFVWITELHQARQSVLRKLGVPYGTMVPKPPLAGLDVHVYRQLGSDENLIPVAHAPPRVLMRGET